jgi:hypothetical protein
MAIVLAVVLSSASPDDGYRAVGDIGLRSGDRTASKVGRWKTRLKEKLIPELAISGTGQPTLSVPVQCLKGGPKGTAVGSIFVPEIGTRSLRGAFEAVVSH